MLWCSEPIREQIIVNSRWFLIWAQNDPKEVQMGKWKSSILLGLGSGEDPSEQRKRIKTFQEWGDFWARHGSWTENGMEGGMGRGKRPREEWPALSSSSCKAQHRATSARSPLPYPSPLLASQNRCFMIISLALVSQYQSLTTYSEPHVLVSASLNSFSQKGQDEDAKMSGSERLCYLSKVTS